MIENPQRPGRGVAGIRKCGLLQAQAFGVQTLERLGAHDDFASDFEVTGKRNAPRSRCPALQ